MYSEEDKMPYHGPQGDGPIEWIKTHKHIFPNMFATAMKDQSAEWMKVTKLSNWMTQI